MFETIMACSKCPLCQKQGPLMDDVSACQVFWVGLSAKLSTIEGEKPLSLSTKSGQILSLVESRCPGVSMYRTNLVKCAPLDGAGKLRYPNKEEIALCLPNLSLEIETLSPKLVFLLGNKVVNAIGAAYSISFDKWNGFEYQATKYNGLYFVAVHHPAYIYVYQRKCIDAYVNGLEKVIRRHICCF